MFFLDTALDQIQFMQSRLDVEGLRGRIEAFVELGVARRELRPQARHLLCNAMLSGTIARGDAARITGTSERSARYLVADLLDRGLLASDTEKGPLRLGIPLAAVPYYFPQLYPEPVEIGLVKAERPPRRRRRKEQA